MSMKWRQQSVSVRRLLRLFSSYVHTGRVMSGEEMAAAAHHHKEKMQELLQKELYKDKNHPVYNFLFTYVFVNPKNLFRYSPGLGTLIKDFSHKDIQSSNIYATFPECTEDNNTDTPWVIKPPPNHYTLRQLKKFAQTLQMLKKVQGRQPLLNCYGLHEWAMLYRKLPSCELSEKKLSKFQQLPLRVTQNTIASVVENNRLRCTHYDAFRFFTADATPLNTISPTRATVAINDQPGCVHVTIDLFKWTMKLFPYCSSELLYDALRLAVSAREVDMRASPYDLKHYENTSGLPLGIGMSCEPILIETVEGRKEYQRHQERLFRKASDVRRRVIAVYSEFLHHSKV